MATNNIPTSVDYTSRDFYSLRNDLIARVQANLPAWTGTDTSDFGVALVEAFAYMGDIINYYIDRVANENYLATATQRSSLLNIAKTYGYTPSGYQAALLNLTMTNKTSSAITIPAGTELLAEVTYKDVVLGLIFKTQSSVTLGAAGSGTEVQVVSASHGEDVSLRAANALNVSIPGDINGEYLGSSDGSANQYFSLLENQVVDNSVSVYVQNGNVFEKWNQVLHLTDYGPTDAVYSLEYDSENYVYVTFGDGVSGAIPNINSMIKATYIYGGGVVGNISANNSFTFNTLPSGAVISLPTSSSITVTNSTQGLGGADPESNSSIRNNAPLALRTMSRAVTLQDFEDLALMYSSVGKANAVAATKNSVVVYVAPYRTNNATDLYPGKDSSNTVVQNELTTLQTALTSFLSDKLQIGTTVTVLPPVYVPVKLTVQYVKQASYTDAQVQANITGALIGIFGYNYVNFADVIYPEEIEYQLRQVDGVAAATVVSSYRSSDSAGRKTLAGGASEIFVFSESNLTYYPTSSLTGMAVTPTGGTATFSPVTWSSITYTYTLNTTATSLTFTPTASDSSSVITYSVNGATAVSATTGVATSNISISAGTTPIKFTITDSYGTIANTYTINVIK